MKENLKLISDLVTEGMIFEDSLGNFDFDFTSDIKKYGDINGNNKNL